MHISWKYLVYKLILPTSAFLFFIFFLSPSNAVGSPPEAPSELGLISGTSSMQISWRDNSGFENGFYVERSTNSIDYVRIATTSANVTSTIAVSLSPDTEYWFRVAAYNTWGMSAYITDSATTLPPPPDAPSAPIFLYVSATYLALSWEAVSGAGYYKIYENGSYLDTFYYTEYPRDDLSPSTSYSYCVSAVNWGGESACSPTVSTTTPSIWVPPLAPSTTTLSNVSTSSLTLSWSEAAGADSYIIYQNGLYFGLTTSITYDCGGLESGMLYSYCVSSFNDFGEWESACSSENSTTTLSVPGVASVMGTVNYYDGIHQVAYATVMLEDGSHNILTTTTADGNGVYIFSNVTSGQEYYVAVSTSSVPTTSARGVTSADQLKIGRHVVGIEIFDSVYKKIAADMNWSGTITSADQLKIGRFFVGMHKLRYIGNTRHCPKPKVLA